MVTGMLLAGRHQIPPRYRPASAATARSPHRSLHALADWRRPSWDRANGDPNSRVSIGRAWSHPQPGTVQRMVRTRADITAPQPSPWPKSRPIERTYVPEPQSMSNSSSGYANRVISRRKISTGRGVSSTVCPARARSWARRPATCTRGKSRRHLLDAADECR